MQQDKSDNTALHLAASLGNFTFFNKLFGILQLLRFKFVRKRRESIELCCSAPQQRAQWNQAAPIRQSWEQEETDCCLLGCQEFEYGCFQEAAPGWL
jgi:hypothetical protein